MKYIYFSLLALIVFANGCGFTNEPDPGAATEPSVNEGGGSHLDAGLNPSPDPNQQAGAGGAAGFGGTGGTGSGLADSGPSEPENAPDAGPNDDGDAVSEVSRQSPCSDASTTTDGAIAGDGGVDATHGDGGVESACPDAGPPPMSHNGGGANDPDVAR